MPNRVRLSRVKGWRMPPDTIKVARPGVFGNPWRVGNPGQLVLRKWPVTYDLQLPIDNQSAVNAYRLWLVGDYEWWMGPPVDMFHTKGWELLHAAIAEARAALLSALPTLRGKHLACTCHPDQPCHADVLLEIANR